MDADILQRFAAWSGRRFEMKFQDLGSATIALGTGQCDVVNACLYVTDERKESVNFTVPYYLCRGGYFVIDKEDASTVGFGERLRINLVTEGRWKLIMDLTRASDLIRSRTFDALMPLLFITVAYFVLAWLIRLLFNLFLKK